VSRDQFGHLEHGYLILTVEYCLQLVVSDDFTPVRWVLQIVRFDVIPKLLGQFRTGQGIRPNYCRKRRIWSYRFHESRVGLFI